MRAQSRAPRISLSSAPATLLRTLSLDSLRGFEASARLLSFTAAADELCLTQSAISKQVRTLEEALGAPVFERGARRLSLTPEGRRLAERVGAALELLESALEEATDVRRASVGVSVTPSFASLWLAPRLSQFTREAPDVNLRIEASDARVALEREGLDIAVRLSRLETAERGWQMLTRERVMLVAAPGVAGHINGANDLLRLPLLAFRHPLARAHGASWSDWYDRLALPKSPRQPVYQFSQYEHLVKAASGGAGVAIGRAPLILPALRSGALVTVLPDVSIEGLGYFLVRSARSLARPAVSRFAQWLDRELALDVMG